MKSPFRRRLSRGVFWWSAQSCFSGWEDLIPAILCIWRMQIYAGRSILSAVCGVPLKSPKAQKSCPLSGEYPDSQWHDIWNPDLRYFMYMEDADLCRQVNLVSSLWYCPGTAVIHKWERGSHKDGRLFRLHIRSMLQYFRKWGWKLW